jgi:hypothetical protein
LQCCYVFISKRKHSSIPYFRWLFLYHCMISIYIVGVCLEKQLRELAGFCLCS